MIFRHQHWLNRQVGIEAMLLALRRATHAAVAAAIESTEGAAAQRSDDDMAASVLRASAALQRRFA